MEIKMKSRFASILFTVAIISITLNANAFGFTTIGAPTCKSWIKDINTVTDKTNMQWIVGYVSGVAGMFSTENKIDLLENADGKSIFLWTDKFCTANPNKDITEAGDTFVFELVKQRMPQR